MFFYKKFELWRQSLDFEGYELVNWHEMYRKSGDAIR